MSRSENLDLSLTEVEQMSYEVKVTTSNMKSFADLKYSFAQKVYVGCFF